MTNYYNLKLHRVLVSDLLLIRKPDNSDKNKIFMRGLEESISELGVLMPLLVIQSKDDEYKFILIDGYKRLEILKKLDNNILAVNVLIADGSPENMSFSVNRVRGELSKLYQALYLHNILVKEKITQDELAKRFMLSKGEISKLLSVVKQPQLVDMVKSGMSMTSAKTLATSVSSLKPQIREIQLNNLKSSVNYKNLPTRKFEKITNIMSNYINKTNTPLEPYKLKKIETYVNENKNYIDDEKILSNILNNKKLPEVKLTGKKVLSSLKQLSENISDDAISYNINNNGLVMLKLKLTEEEMRKLKNLLGIKNF